MLLVHPAHELLRQLPLLIGSVVLGSATGNQMWSVAVLVLLIVFGVARWFTTTYRVDGEQIQRREGCCSARCRRCRATGFDRCRPTPGCCTGSWG